MQKGSTVKTQKGSMFQIQKISTFKVHKGSSVKIQKGSILIFQKGSILKVQKAGFSGITEIPGIVLGFFYQSGDTWETWECCGVFHQGLSVC